MTYILRTLPNNYIFAVYNNGQYFSTTTAPWKAERYFDREKAKSARDAIKYLSGEDVTVCELDARNNAKDVA